MQLTIERSALLKALGHVQSVVERVYEEDEELLQFFDAEGIRPGVPIRVVERAPKRGTVTAVFGEKEVVLGTDAARLIWVPEA